jgi:hypothetical protein
MHLGMAWFEQDSGTDLTPCHDANGTWNPGPGCEGFPLQPATGGGAWPSCNVGAVSGAASTCGDAYGDPQPQPEPDPEPEPQPEGDSCADSCGGEAPGGCWCDEQCSKYGDCCGDHLAQCKPQASCAGSCGGKTPSGCWCDEQCSKYGDCCGDKLQVCG